MCGKFIQIILHGLQICINIHVYRRKGNLEKVKIVDVLG